MPEQEDYQRRALAQRREEDARLEAQRNAPRLGASGLKLAGPQNNLFAAHQAYGLDSDYGKALTSDQKAEAYKKLSGQDFDAMTYNDMGRGGYNSLASQLKALYTPAGMRGGGGQLSGGVGGRDLERNTARAEQLKAQLLDHAYTSQMNNVFEDSNADHLGKLGDGVRWQIRTNRLTGEQEQILDKHDDENNFYRKNKDNIIRAGGGIVGGILGSIVPGVGTAYGAAAGASLAGATRDAYKNRQGARRAKDAMRDWENDPGNQPWTPTSGNLYQSAGEAVVDYKTKDIEKKKKGQYLKETTS